MAALDRDLWVMDAEPEELVGDGLAKAGLQWIVAGCRLAEDDEDAQDWAVLHPGQGPAVIARGGLRKLRD